METVLLELISDESLNNLIENCTNLQTLKCLLQVKRQKILVFSCEKKHFSIDFIYKTDKNIDLVCEILEIILFVDADNNQHVSKTIEFCLNNFSSNNPEDWNYSINLFNVVLNYIKTTNSELNLIETDFKRFKNGVLNILKTSSKPIQTFTLVEIISSFSLSSPEYRDKLLLEIFQFVATTKKIEILCVCFENFINTNLKEQEFNLLKLDDFWCLVMDSLTSVLHYTRKQACYLLLKSIEIVLNNNNKFQVPKILKTDSDSDDLEKIWKNYSILLDICNEKQLHIVEPSLCLFESVNKLKFSWRLCLYKNFLNHSQNLVVYKTAIFILHNESEWKDISKIIVDLLSAINKNEYNSQSRTVFLEISNFCHKLNSNQFEELLTNSLSIVWIPAAIWSFYNSIFTEKYQLQFSLSLLEKHINQLKRIPHRFIRESCKKIILKYFIKNCEVECVKDILKLLLLVESDESFYGILFESFLQIHVEKIKFFIDDWQEQLLNSLLSSDETKNIIILFKLVDFLNVDYSSKIISIMNDIPVRNILFLQDIVNDITLEDYLWNKFDQIIDFSDALPFLQIIEKVNSTKLLKKTSNFLTNKQLDIQCVLAYGLSLKHETHDFEFTLQFCQACILSPNINENLAQFFLIILIKKISTFKMLEDCLIFFDSLLDYQNSLTFTILENISLFLNHIDDERFLVFIQKCFQIFLITIKNGDCSKKFTKTFLIQLFSSYLVENNKFCKLLLNYLQTLLNIANRSNSIAYILSETLAKFIKQNLHSVHNFIPFIVDLFFYGITINKNERVEYCICQEIELNISAETNPNFEEILTKLWAVELILNLVNQESENRDKNADTFCTILMEKYRKHFSKRVFPDSQIHLEKLRIVQALLLLHQHLKETKNELIELLVESFITENHQPSVKHVMQWLLVLLLKNNNYYIGFINNKLKTINNNRPSTVSGFIPVLYHLISSENETHWDELTEILLPYTLGAQFKLRIFSQVALVKIYERAVKLKYKEYLEKHKYLYKSLKEVIEATSKAQFDLTNINHDFLDYFNIEICDYSTIFYTIPKSNSVTEIEWQNLLKVSIQNDFQYLNFTHSENTNNRIINDETQVNYNENIQKKITPWKELLIIDSNNYTTDFILVTSLIEKPTNLGGLSRTCEIFGIKKMVMRTAKITSDQEYKSLSVSSENWVEIIEVKIEELQTFIVEIKKQDYCVVGAEQTAESIKLDQFKFPKKTVLVLGNEKEGIAADLIPFLDKCIEIPQFGLVRSLNVHVAGAIIVWEYCKQHRL